MEWIKAKSHNLWGLYYYSNKFYIKYEFNDPPAVLNMFDLLILYQGEASLYPLPDDLFVDPNGDSLSLNAFIISWDSKNKIIFKIPSNILILSVLSPWTTTIGLISLGD